MAVKWDRVTIERDNGERIDNAIAPIIISASRSTDIPAFYSDWFMNRIKSGYAIWKNPFNGKEQYVSFEKARCFVFWSKNPKPIIEHLDELENLDISFYFQYTLNYYDHLAIEPNVPSVDDRINTFIQLSQKLGKERVIWRFDPLITSDSFPITELINRVKYVGDALHKYTNKLVFSFADVKQYSKVERHLNKMNMGFREFSLDEMHYLAKIISELTLKWGIEACTCGERLDLEKYGINHNKCIDDELIFKISNQDPVLRIFFGIPEPQLFESENTQIKVPKDKGQRVECGCISSKDIGRYNTCPHQCIYCYANVSPAVAIRNNKTHNSDSEAII